MPVKPLQDKASIKAGVATKKLALEKFAEKLEQKENKRQEPAAKIKEIGDKKKKEIDDKKKKEIGDKKIKTEEPVKSTAPKSEETESKPVEEVQKTERKRVVIPFVLPWESRPCVQNQHGMRAFGTGRNVFTQVNQGSKEMPTDRALKSESVLPLLADTHDLATQHGMRIGSFRDNVSKPEFGSKEIDKEKLLACQAIIPKQSGSNECHGQSGQTPMGALRHNIMKVQFKDGMTSSMEKESKGFLTKFATPNPNSHAGSAVMDKIRKQVPEGMRSTRRKHSIRTEAILPKFQVRTGLDTCQGTGAGTHGLGPFRQTVTRVQGGYKFTEEEEVASKLAQPWVTSASLSSQQGTGGFQQRRDVVSHVKYNF